MANFIGFGQSIAKVANVCVNNDNKQDIAQFLINQQIIIQNNVIDDRLNANKNEQAKANTTGGVNASSGNSSKGKAAFERMKAMAGKK